MARIPDEEIERLKREVSLADLVRGSGVELRGSGDNLAGRCPFHEDDTPSLIVTVSRNLWHCMGACNEGGSVIDWVKKLHNVGFRHAVEILQEGNGALALPARPLKDGHARVLPRVVSPDITDERVMIRVVDYYHETLLKSPEALAYLEKRGLHLCAEMVGLFKLGFANRTLGLRLPEKACEEGRAVRERLARLGILRADSGHEHLNGSLVIPILDEQGNVQQLYGRKITANLRKGTPNHLYLPGPLRGVWNINALAGGSGEVILCEALIDALTFWCAGFRGVTASYGTHGFTDDHRAAFERYGIGKVHIAYDRDEAGDEAAEQLAAELAPKGIDCFRVQFPPKMDANEFALLMKPASEHLGALLARSLWMRGGRSSVARHPPAPPQDPPGREEPRSLDAGCGSPSAASAEAKPRAVPATEAASVPAAAASAQAAPACRVESTGNAVTIQLQERTYRVLGLAQCLKEGQLRVTIRATAPGERLFADMLDLYSARARQAFERQLAAELGIPPEAARLDTGRLLLQLEELQAQEIRRAQEPKRSAAPALSRAEELQALELLSDPRLFDRVLEAFDRIGVVGEETNKLLGYIAAASRKLPDPIGLLIQSSSAAGKSALLDAILALVPGEEQVRYSAMTGQALFYMEETDLAHKVLAIVEGEGAEKAQYSLKLLLSEKELRIASAGRDPATGKILNRDYHVEGPVMLLLTTTEAVLDEELQNRCLVLTVDERPEQTQAIHRRQRERETSSGILAAQDRDALLAVHRNAQRMLRPLVVVNEYAPQLTFPDRPTRTRRDQPKYLALIRAIALLLQYQRPQRTLVREDGRTLDVLDVTPQDVALANRLALVALGRSLDDLPPQSRELLEILDRYVVERSEGERQPRCEIRFTRRQAREHTRWSETQLRTHLDCLVKLEYLVVHHGSRGQTFVYELCWKGEGRDGRPFIVGLVDPSTLVPPAEYDRNLAAQSRHFAAGNGDLAGTSLAVRTDVASPSDPHAEGLRGLQGDGNGTSRCENRGGGGSVVPVLDSPVVVEASRKEGEPRPEDGA